MFWRLIVFMLEWEREASLVELRPHTSHLFAIKVFAISNGLLINNYKIYAIIFCRIMQDMILLYGK